MMGHPWGQAKIGAVGTTPVEMQHILWSQYQSLGLLRGCEVTGNAGMSMSVAAGAGVAASGTRRAVIVPVAATTVTLAAAPTSGSRTDAIYARVDNGAVAVATGKVGLPAQVLPIAEVIVPAGATSGAACQIPADRNWAMPSGGVRLLYSWASSMAYAQVLPDTEADFGTGSFYCDQDQRLDLQFWASWRSRTTGALNAYDVEIYIDNTLAVTYRVGVDSTGNSSLYSVPIWVTAGRHTVRAHRTKVQSNGVVEYIGGGAKKIQPSALRVLAMGITA